MSPRNATAAAPDEAYMSMRQWAVPLGGSAWGKFFAGPKKIPICDFAPLVQPDTICLPDGSATTADIAAETCQEVALALAAGPGVVLAFFLGVALPCVMAAQKKWDVKRLVGPPPTPAQQMVLHRLDLARQYRILHRPTRFAQLLTLPPAAEHAAPSGPEFLALMARLRQPMASNVPFTLAILPPGQGEKFALRNRASVLAWLRARRVGVLTPETSPFEDIATQLARATRVLMMDPRQAGLLGLCTPGTKVLEVAPEGWASGRCRALCSATGLQWRIFLATPPGYPLLRPLSFGATTSLSYEIPIDSLAFSLKEL